MANEPSRTELEALAQQLESSGDYRVLRRFVPPGRYAEPGGATPRTALAVDVETTGFDARTDAIIQLAAVPFEYDADSGAVFTVREPLAWLEDPGRPIPPEIVKLTGIGDADVAGKRIDDAAVQAALGSGGLVIAHNAAFDRPFLERRLPAFRDAPWACSMADVPWKAFGYSSSSQECLLSEHCRAFHRAHRADADALALIHLLATPTASGALPMLSLLRSARRKTIRLWATGAPYDAKDALKARRYRWNPGEDGRPKAWYREVPEDERSAEEKWLAKTVYGGATGKWKAEVIDARSRYSDRA